MQYVVDPSAPEPIMLLNGDIGAGGISGALFQAELLALDAMGKSCIKVYVNSNGGLVSDGMAIYNSILKSKTKVDTYNCGIAASIAAVIFQAGRKRVMADYSILMFHAPYYEEGGKQDAYLKYMEQAIAVMIQRSGMSRDAVTKLLNSGDTFLNATEAKKLGLCDEIERSADLNVNGNSIAAALQRKQGISAIFKMKEIAARHKQR